MILEYLYFYEPVVNVAKAFRHCFRSFDSAAGRLSFICDIFGLKLSPDLFFTVRQLEGEALEELMHKKLLTAPPSCRVLNMIIFSMLILIWSSIIITMIIIMVFVDDHNLGGRDDYDGDYNYDFNNDPQVPALS